MRIGVFGHECRAEQLPVVKDLFDKLNELKAAVYIQDSFDEVLRDHLKYTPQIQGYIGENGMDLDIALSVGGDGTFLRTVLQINHHPIPILGINTGRLGFLADISSNQINETLEELFRGDYKIEERSLLQLEAEGYDFHGFNYALNEISVLKRESSSMITVHTSLNDEYLISYQADGLVVATPTGSTAYSMSVNGPIVLPQNNNFILSPVAPHSLNMRPIVIPDDFTISLKVESRTSSYMVSLDGRSQAMPDGVVLQIRKADFKTRLVKRFNHTFYRTMREKLMWGADGRR
jgi:NAD+ kinase